MSKYRIEDMRVQATPEEIRDAWETTFKKADFFSELAGPCLAHLPFELVEPYLREGVTRDEWADEPWTDEKLQEDFAHYRDWWAQKVTDGRGISVYRGKAQFAVRMMVAGLPEWEELWQMDGGWYEEDAYNCVADLFGFEHVRGCRDD